MSAPATPRRALITGVAGQDGHYLARLLCARGYAVHGLDMAERRPDDLDATVRYAACDVTRAGDLLDLVRAAAPDEIYNLAAQSHVSVSFEQPDATERVNAAGASHVLAAARALAASRPVRVYQASSSEMFGGLPGTDPQCETTPFAPQSPYARAKVAAYRETVRQREEHGLFACNGILFNHESPRRPPSYVTRKITRGAARIAVGLDRTLALGNLDVRRDWGFAGDYVEAMWLMLQQERADDYVVATGEARTVREFVQQAFSAVDLDWERHVVVDPRFFRPSEVHVVRGDPSKARRVLGWRPSTPFESLVRMMVEHDLALARAEAAGSPGP